MSQLPNLLIVDDTEENLILLEAVTSKMELKLIKARSGIEALEKTQGLELALAIIDVRMPVMDGFATAAWLKEKHPAILVIALSVQDDDESLIKMIKAGARGYLHKNVHPVELEKALQTLVSKGMYYPDWATSKVFLKMGQPDEQTNNKDVVITEREREFLQYAGTELTYKEIGEKMFCSPRTVESYRDSLFEKLDLKTRVGLVVYAIKNNLLKL